MSAEFVETAVRVSPLRRLWESLVAAVMFLTIVPVPKAMQPKGTTAHSDGAVWFPLIGAGIGAAAGAVRMAGYHALGAGPSTALGFLVAVGMTGALHQDALADCADAVGVRAPAGGDEQNRRERRLEVMRESTLGVYGILALGLWGLLMYSALERMSPVHGLLALIAASAVARLASVVHVAVVSPARENGLGAGFRPGQRTIFCAALIAVAIVQLAVTGIDGVVVVGVWLITTVTTAVFAVRTLGGGTGDTAGAAAAVTEVTVVVVLSGLLTR